MLQGIHGPADNVSPLKQPLIIFIKCSLSMKDATFAIQWCPPFNSWFGSIATRRLLGAYDDLPTLASNGDTLHPAV